MNCPLSLVHVFFFGRGVCGGGLLGLLLVLLPLQTDDVQIGTLESGEGHTCCRPHCIPLHPITLCPIEVPLHSIRVLFNSATSTVTFCWSPWAPCYSPFAFCCIGVPLHSANSIAFCHAFIHSFIVHRHLATIRYSPIAFFHSHIAVPAQWITIPLHPIYFCKPPICTKAGAIAST